MITTIRRIHLEILNHLQKNIAHSRHNRRLCPSLLQLFQKLEIKRLNLHQVAKQALHVCLAHGLALAQTLHVHVNHDLKVVYIVGFAVDELVNAVLAAHFFLAESGNVDALGFVGFVPALGFDRRVRLR